MTSTYVDLWMSAGENPIHALSIPVDKCQIFSVNLKWLRFLGYTIYGRKGYISTSVRGEEVDDYAPNIQAGSYYFISDHAPLFLDVDGITDRTSNASNLSSTRENFREKLIDRDGTCVMTGEPARLCDACHIIPHAKGDDYISNLIDHRGDAENSLQLDSINDIRNGLLLAASLHRSFGVADVAFLQTPNFALTVNDIPYHTLPEESPASRLTFQHFKDDSPVIRSSAPHNSDARQPGDMNQWPPALILDYFYGCAALKAWGQPDFIAFIRESTKKYYHDNDESDDDDLGSQRPMRAEPKRIREQAQARDERHEKRRRMAEPTDNPEEREVSDMMDVVMALWRSSTRKDLRPPRTDQASDINRGRENVKAWLNSPSLSTSTNLG